MVTRAGEIENKWVYIMCNLKLLSHNRLLAPGFCLVDAPAMAQVRPGRLLLPLGTGESRNGTTQEEAKN